MCRTPSPNFSRSAPGTGKENITHFIEQVNNHHATVKFTAEISENEVTFLDAIVYKGKGLTAGQF